MKILLFGKNGQVGWELNRSLQPLGEVIALGRDEADFTDPESLRDIVQNINPDVIVNAVAYTAVDKAEEEEKLATAINGIVPGVLAEEALKQKALLIHYSTDYVFDGSKNDPYKETDEPKPINAYGRTKLAGEQAIRSSGCKFYIFRTSWVYSARGNNFLKSILRLVLSRDVLSVVDDQVGSPTQASVIADITADILKSYVDFSDFKSGLFHLASQGSTSWYGFTRCIVERYKEHAGAELFDNLEINPISSEEFKMKAQRPMNSRLDTGKIQDSFDLDLPEWEESLSAFVAGNVSLLESLR